MDELIFTMLSFMTFLPLSSRFNLIRIGVLACFFMIKMRCSSTMRGTNALLFRMLFSPIIPVLMVLMLDALPISLSLVTHEIMRLVYVVMLIFVCTRLRVRFDHVYRTAQIILLANLVIQIGQYLGISVINSFLRSNYVTGVEGEWTHLELASYGGSGFRAGSIFINPNVYISIPLVSLGVFLQKDYNGGNLLSTVCILAALVSCFLTGSRTAMVLSAVVICLYFIRYSRGTSKMMILCVVVAGIGMIAGMGLQGMRALQLTEGGSIKVKLLGYTWYFQTSNVVYWLTGSIGSRTVASIDSEWGHIYTWYGLWGILWYVDYYRMIWRRNREFAILSPVLVIAVVLTAFTSSVLLAMQVFSFVGALLFSKIENNRKVSSDLM